MLDELVVDAIDSLQEILKIFTDIINGLTPVVETAVNSLEYAEKIESDLGRLETLSASLLDITKEIASSSSQKLQIAEATSLKDLYGLISDVLTAYTLPIDIELLKLNSKMEESSAENERLKQAIEKLKVLLSEVTVRMKEGYSLLQAIEPAEDELLS